MKALENKFLWVEKYRPQKIKDCILPERIKQQFSAIAEAQSIPNMILSGGPGCGKTTVAKALCNEVDSEYLFINTSEDTGIDVLRNEITKYASSASLNKKRKVVILDEFDYSSPNLQAGLRSAIEKFSGNCSFILTCNYPNRIIDAMFSRTVHIPFEIKADEKADLAKQFFVRCCQVLDNEGTEYDKPAIAALAKKTFPDFRKGLGMLDQFSKQGKIDSGVIDSFSQSNISALLDCIKAKNFRDARQWIAENAGSDLVVLYRELYKHLMVEAKSECLPEVILVLEEYQRFHQAVPDLELHMAALCMQLMASVVFK